MIRIIILLFSLSEIKCNILEENIIIKNNNASEIMKRYFKSENSLFCVNIIYFTYQTFDVILSNNYLPYYVITKHNFQFDNNTCQGNIIVYSNSSSLIEYLKSDLKNNVFQNGRNIFLIYIQENIATNEAKNIFEILWKKYKTPHLIMTFFNSEVYYFYNDFLKYNKMKIFTSQELMLQNDLVKNKMLDFNGYYLNVGIFQTSMAFPVYRNKVLTHFTAVEGTFLSSVKEHLHFNINFRIPPDQTYGSQLPNGSFNGALKLLIDREVEFISIEYFIKDYFSSEIEFSSVALEDTVCIIKHKAERIPQWMLLYYSFDKRIWVLLVAAYLVLYITWSFLEYVLKTQHNYKQINYLGIEVFRMMLTSSLFNLPNTTSERVFLSFGLLSFLTLTGAFQGSLVNVLSNPLYDSEINTLEELSKSDYPIITEHFWVADDIFNDLQNPVILKLKQKIVVRKDEKTIDEIIKNKEHIVCLTIDLNKKTRIYAKGNEFIHVVKEYVINYNLAYVFNKNSAFCPRIGKMVSRLSQGGFFKKWYNDMLIQNRNTQGGIKYGIEKEFSIEDLKLIFYALTIGYILSVVVFVIEIFVIKINK